MIINCLLCGKSVRIDKNKYAGKRVKMRCRQCGDLFVAEVPVVQSSAEERSEASSAMKILVAHSDPALCDTVGRILSNHDLPWKSCHDGESALQLMDKQPPAVAIVDVALPGLFAFEVVERVRSRPGLANVKIILLSSVYNKMAYKRRPNTLYGADDYIEKHHIPLDLIDKINQLIEQGDPDAGQSRTIENAHPLAGPAATVDSLQQQLQRAEESESLLNPDEEAALAKARRLARIIASDISLYDEAKVAEGIRSGTFLELFAAEIAEGRQHFLSRIPESLPQRGAIFDDAFNELIDHLSR